MTAKRRLILSRTIKVISDEIFGKEEKISQVFMNPTYFRPTMMKTQFSEKLALFFTVWREILSLMDFIPFFSPHLGW